MAKNPFGDTPLKEKNPFGDSPANQTSPFEPKQEKVGFGENLYRTLGGAARDVGVATAELLLPKDRLGPLNVAKGIREGKTLEEIATDPSVLEQAIKSVPTVPEPTYPGGSIARDLSGFAIPFAGISKRAGPLTGLTTGQKIAKGAGIGGVAEQFAFSPYEQRVSNLVQQYPALQNPVAEFLQADPEDNEAVARFKMAVEGAAIGVPFDYLLRQVSKIKIPSRAKAEQPFVGPKPDPFIGPRPGAVVEPPIVEPKIEAPKKRPRANKMPEVLVKPKQPKGIKKVSSLLQGSIPRNDPQIEEIARAMGTSPKKLSSYYKTKKAPESVSATGEVKVRSDALEIFTEKLNELQMAPLVGKRGSIDERGINDFGQADALEILEKNPPLPEYAAKYDEYLEKLNQYDSLTSTLERADIDPDSLKGKTNEEVGEIIEAISEFEDVLQVPVPPSFKTTIESPPIELYEQDISRLEPRMPSNFINKVNETPPDFAGNINLNKIDSPDEIKNAINAIAENEDAFMEARRGVVKFGSDGAELRALAEETGLTADQLISRKKGSAFNAETAYAARLINQESATDLVKLAKKAQGNNASPNDFYNFEEALTKHVAIQEQLAGITAEAGRALRQFRETARSEEALQAKAIGEYVQAKGRGNIEEMAVLISNLDTPEQIAKFSKDALKPKFRDKLQEAWINALLSSPSTHIVNVVSNGIVAATRMPEYAVGALFGAARKGSDKISFTEFSGRIYGSMYGLLDGLRAFKDALIDPKSVDDPLTKLELQRQNSISGIKGEIIRLPGRFLTAEDQLFKSVGYRQELWGQALRKAKAEGKGIKRAYEIMDDPAKNFPDIQLKAQETARYQTFTNPLGSTGQKVQGIINNHPWTRYIAPFVRTPVNIVKYAGERTPFGIFAKSYKDAIKKGGAEADLARARVALGSTAMASVAMLANDGLITGRGPADYRENNVLRETGWQPYSIRVGDTYYAYNRFEPVGILFGLAADWADIYKYADKSFTEENGPELGKLAAMLGASFTENITNKTFLTGVSDFINVIFNPDRYGEASIQRFLSSFVPTASYYVRKAEDPIMRDAQTLTDQYLNRIPGLSTELPAKRNVFGEIRTFSKGAAPKWMGGIGETFSPVATSTVKNDVVFEELAKLKIVPVKPKRQIYGVDIDSRQYEDMLKEMLSLNTKNVIKSVIESPGYDNLPPMVKIEAIKSILSDAQKEARERTFNKNPELAEKQMQELMKELGQTQ